MFSRPLYIKKFCGRATALSVLLIALFSFASPLMAESVTKLKAEGSSVKLEEHTLIRSSAIDDALRNAVIESYESLFKDSPESRAGAENVEALLERAMDYVLDYRVLSEGWITHLDRPDDSDDLIEEDIADTEAALEKMAENAEAADQKIEATAESAAAEAAAEPGAEAGAGTETLDPMEKKAAEDAAAEKLAATDGVLEPAEAGRDFYHVWVEASINMEQLKKDTLRLSVADSKRTNKTRIMILDVTDYPTYTSLKKEIEGVEIVKELGVDSFMRGRIILIAKIWGNSDMLLERLKEKNIPGIALIPGGRGSIIIRSVSFR